MTTPLPKRVQLAAEKHGAVVLVSYGGRWEVRRMDETAHRFIAKHPNKVVGVYTSRARYAMIAEDLEAFATQRREPC